MADPKSGAYASKASDTDFRKKWDKQEYTERARKKDDEERERMQENEARMKQGTPPPSPSTHRHLTPPQAKHPARGARKTCLSRPSS